MDADALPKPETPYPVNDTTTSSRPLRRREAPAYLKEKWGIDRAASTLAKLAVIGGGPAYRKAGRHPLYDPPDLDDWARSLIGPRQRSTSDGAAS